MTGLRNWPARPVDVHFGSHPAPTEVHIHRIAGAAADGPRLAGPGGGGAAAVRMPAGGAEARRRAAAGRMPAGGAETVRAGAAAVRTALPGRVSRDPAGDAR